VLYLDGEMAGDDIQERDRVLATAPEIITIAADWQETPLPLLDTPEGQEAIAPYAEWAEVIIVDNRACLFDPAGEKDIEAWEPALIWLMAQRRLKKANLMVHHSGRNGNARGLSRPEDPLNLTIALKQPPRLRRGARRAIPGHVHQAPEHSRRRGSEVIRDAANTSRMGYRGCLTPVERALLTTVDKAWQDGKPIQAKTHAIHATKGKGAGKTEGQARRLGPVDRLEAYGPGASR
jgi:hypothetical protein